MLLCLEMLTAVAVTVISHLSLSLTSQGDLLAGLDHEQCVYRLERPTRKLHGMSQAAG